MASVLKLQLKNWYFYTLIITPVKFKSLLQISLCVNIPIRVKAAIGAASNVKPVGAVYGSDITAKHLVERVGRQLGRGGRVWYVRVRVWWGRGGHMRGW